MEQNRSRKKYEKPELTVYGQVSEITAQGGFTYSDVPQGTACNGTSVTGS